ncbi:MAG: DM13 domain-containing protein [Promethearchaeota archaeon]
MYLIPIAIIISGLSIGVGSYFLLAPRGGTNQVPNEDPDENPNGTLPSGTVLLNGTFIMFDSAHYGHGIVQIVELPNSNRQVQFVEVDLAIGPDLYVYLSDKSVFSGIRDSAGNFKSLGLLPKNTGNFTMGLGGMSLTNVNSVLIWCKQFSVAFTYASLS